MDEETEEAIEEDLEESLDSPKKPSAGQPSQELQTVDSDDSADLDEMEDLFKATASGSDSIGTTPVASPSISKLQHQIGFDSKPHLLQGLSGSSSAAPRTLSSLRPQSIQDNDNSGTHAVYSDSLLDEDFLEE